ncbi:hypothetical protein FS749_015463 [Ceratobasidium sp. UAMH 11750]|nr:hypothetical protein FS749_015463 [Ceratobasidium sp. UAMH 11750]
MPLSKLYSNSLMATLISRGGWDSGMTRVPAAGTTGSILVHVTTVRERELDRPIEKPKSHSQVPNDHVGQTTSEADNSFELHDYAGHHKVGLEAAQSVFEPPPSLSPTSEAIGVRRGAKKRVEIAELRGVRVSTPDEWSVNSPTVVSGGK